MLSLISATSAMKTHFVYWNSTNPAFRLDNTEHVIDVNNDNLPWEYDQLHLICPQNTGEQHVVYSVTEEEYNSCRVTNPRPKIVAICNKPDSFMYFTITFRSFSPTPGGLEFKPGQNYYFISTSTTRDIHRRVGGYCSSHNMKMVFRVADNTVHNVQEDNLLHPLSLNEPRQIPVSLRNEPQYTRVWNARVPQHRNDYIYYYKPWNQQRFGRAKQQQPVNLQPALNNNEILTALPFTSSSPTIVCSSPAATLAILIAVFVKTLLINWNWLAATKLSSVIPTYSSCWPSYPQSFTLLRNHFALFIIILFIFDLFNKIFHHMNKYFV